MPAKIIAKVHCIIGLCRIGVQNFFQIFLKIFDIVFLLFIEILPKKSQFANLNACIDKNVFYTIFIVCGGVHMLKTDFEIIPIFNQPANPRVWHDFTELEMRCDSEKYNYSVDDRDRTRIFKGHMDDWMHQKYNMAFAAYRGEQMLGFASGFEDPDSKSEIYLHNLYVDPKLNGMGIGRQLLEKMEKAASLVSEYMDLISLNGALSFYESCGYKNFDDRYLFKKLEKIPVGVIPVFKWRKKMRAKLNMDVDYGLLQHSKNQPIFVYVSYGKEIDGVALKLPDGKDVVWVNQNKGQSMAEFYKQQLLKALSKVR